MEAFKSSHASEDDVSTESGPSSFDTGSFGSKFWNTSSWVTGNNYQESKILVTLWETLETVEMDVHNQMTFPEFINAVHQVFPRLSSIFTTYYLRDGSMWNDRIRISHTGDLLAALDELNTKSNLSGKEIFSIFLDVAPSQLKTKRNIGKKASQSDKSLPLVSYISDEPISIQFTADTAVISSHISELQKQQHELEMELEQEVALEEQRILEGDPAAVEESVASADTPITSSEQVSNIGSEFDDSVLQRDGGICVFCSSAMDTEAVQLLADDCDMAGTSLTMLGLESFADPRNGITVCLPCKDLFLKKLLFVVGADCSMVVLAAAVPLIKVKPTWSLMNGKPLRVPKDAANKSKWPTAALWKHYKVVHGLSVPVSCSRSGKQAALAAERETSAANSAAANASVTGAGGGGGGIRKVSSDEYENNTINSTVQSRGSQQQSSSLSPSALSCRHWISSFIAHLNSSAPSSRQVVPTATASQALT